MANNAPLTETGIRVTRQQDVCGLTTRAFTRSSNMVAERLVLDAATELLKLAINILTTRQEESGQTVNGAKKGRPENTHKIKSGILLWMTGPSLERPEFQRRMHNRQLCFLSL